MIIGLTGGIGSGKSAAAALFKDIGVDLIDADDLARDSLNINSEGYKLFIEKFGDKYLDENKNINRELMGDIVTQQCAVYKLNIEETRVNIYGESSGAKYYQEPVLLNVLLERGDQTYNSSDMGVDYTRDVEFRFFRDTL